MAAAQNMAMTTTQKIIAIAVTIIIISTVAIPVIDDIQKTLVHTAQNTTQLYTAVNSNSDVEVILSDGVLTVNDYDLTDMLGTSEVLVICDSFAIMTYDSLNDKIAVVESSGYNTTTSASIVSGVLTYTPTGGSETTVNVEGNLIYAAEKGAYGNFKSGPIYFNETSKLYIVLTTRLYGSTGASPESITPMGVFSGTYNDLDFSEWYMPTAGDWTYSVSIPNVTNHESYLSFDGGEFKPAYEANNGTYTYNRNTVNVPLIAPIEYTYISDDDSTLSSLIGIIPILLILVPVMLSVRMIALRRN